VTICGQARTNAVSYRERLYREREITNHICHFEIGCRDRANTSAFHARMFDWHVQDVAAALAKAASLGGRRQ